MKHGNQLALIQNNVDKGLMIRHGFHICFQGYDSTIGCSQWIGDPFQEDAVVIKVSSSTFPCIHSSLWPSGIGAHLGRNRL